MMTPEEKARENRARRWAARLGHTLYRSKAKRFHLNNRGLYQLVDGNNVVVEGPNFEADLSRIEDRLQKIEDQMRAINCAGG